MSFRAEGEESQSFEVLRSLASLGMTLRWSSARYARDDTRWSDTPLVNPFSPSRVGMGLSAELSNDATIASPAIRSQHRAPTLRLNLRHNRAPSFACAWKRRP